MKANLARFFAPKSVAIYGVSQDTTKIASTIFSNLVAANYQGKIFPINPKYKTLHGVDCYPSVNKIPHRIDLAVMSVPAELTFKVLKDCYQKGVKNLVIISAGFAEIGEEGVKLQEELRAKAEEYGISIIGPNCLGVLASESRLNASFAPGNIVPGDVAFMSQSGAITTAIMDMSTQTKLGFSHFVSLGNKVNINENDLLNYWLQSDRVKVIAAYLEEFSDGLDFCTSRVNADQQKPVVVLHPGKSKAAREAISSHTGSLAGSDQVISAALKKSGITIVDGVAELSATVQAFSWSRLPAGPRIAVVTNAGGPGILATDAITANGLDLVQLSEILQQEIAKGLPAIASVHNPVDILGDARADRYEHAISSLIHSTEVDAILVILTPQLVTQIEETAKLLVTFSKQTDKPIIPVFLGGEYVSSGIKRFFDNRLMAFSDLDLAVQVLGNLYRFTAYKKSSQQSLDLSKLRRPKTVNLNSYVTDSLAALPEEVVQNLLTEFDIPTPKSKVIRTLEEAADFTKLVGFPVVIKATSEQILHKTDFKAIFLNIDSISELKSNLTELQENIYKATKIEHPEVLIQQQVTGEELILGAKRDGASDVYVNGRGFGHNIVFGKGGIYTEVYKDVANSLLPLTKRQINDLISATKVSQIISGVRGQKSLNRDALIDLINKLQQLLYNYPQIAEVDFNPVMLSEKGVCAVDAKVLVKK